MQDLTQVELDQLMYEVRMDIIIGGRETSILERQARYPKVWEYVLHEADKLCPDRSEDKLHEAMWLAVLCGGATAMEAMEYANGHKGDSGDCESIKHKRRSLLGRLLSKWQK